MMKEKLFSEALEMLQELIEIESLSRNEDAAATAILAFLQNHGVSANRLKNNVWAANKYFDPNKPTLLLNSHHDTVKPNAGYTRNPYEARIEDGKLYGLGSNDAGGALVSLLATFLYFFDREDLKMNLIYAATAEEEISGKDGVELLLPELGPIAMGIVGEPTQMHIAIAEKGLLVLDCTAHGVAGHAARNEGENAIYKALQDITWFQSYKFPKRSEMLGEVKTTVTMVQAGTQHNVVPGECHFTVDVRSTDEYSHEDIIGIIEKNIVSEIKPRSTRLKSSSIQKNHPLVQAGLALGRELYGSPTTSDQALMDFPTIKMGPGNSSRSHSADEFIYVNEIEEGIHLYIQLLEQIL